MTSTLPCFACNTGFFTKWCYYTVPVTHNCRSDMVCLSLQFHRKNRLQTVVSLDNWYIMLKLLLNFNFHFEHKNCSFRLTILIILIFISFKLFGVETMSYFNFFHCSIPRIRHETRISFTRVYASKKNHPS